jgi:hypothetical protein
LAGRQGFGERAEGEAVSEGFSERARRAKRSEARDFVERGEAEAITQGFDPARASEAKPARLKPGRPGIERATEL